MGPIGRSGGTGAAAADWEGGTENRAPIGDVGMPWEMRETGLGGRGGDCAVIGRGKPGGRCERARACEAG
jgi:hypothetical protein